MTHSKSPLLAATFLAAAAAAFGADAPIRPTAPADERFTPQMQEFVESFKPGGHDLAGQIPLLSPQESISKMKLAEGFAAEVAAHEPVIRQPIDMRFDDRGRLWVVQYIQYPFPAGLKIVAYDQYLRAEYDRSLPPPPNHFPGADKVTILEDTDRDGFYDAHKDFLTGLNMATSIALDHDGVWVLQSPYLLFYPDRNQDDVPDGDPEVHLSGFGLEDTHSLAASLHWGPDGWLYGASGSTTNIDIQGVRLLGQGIWRYHPPTRRFEIFAEGGGNTVSFEMDRFGRAYSGTNNGATRGLHYVQGGTYIKNWRKHGPAMNPFIFGFFEHMGHAGYTQRFPQTFLFYEGGLFPSLQGKIVVGMSLTNRVQAAEVLSDTSTFRTVDTVAVLESDDRAFRPVDIEAGPDGSIYLADWYDVRLSHLNPADTWDKAHGRIIRIKPPGYTAPAPFDLRKFSSPDLIQLLSHSNRWYREHARQLLAVRPDDITGTLVRLLEQDSGETSLEALWILNLRGELTPESSLTALRHPNPHVRRWMVRLLGDPKASLHPDLHRELVALARTEQDLEVRSQLASTAMRIPAGQAMGLVRELLARDEDAADKHIPLLIWWAFESHADKGREEILALLQDAKVWSEPIFADHVAERLARRYAADQGPRHYYTLNQGAYSEWQIDYAPAYFKRNLATSARLLELAPDGVSTGRLIAGMAEGMSGAVVENPPESLERVLDELWRSRPRDANLVSLAARLGHPDAVAAAIGLLESGSLSEADQDRLVEFFSSTGMPAALPLVANLARSERDETQRGKLLAALGGFEDPAAADVVMDIFPELSPRLRIASQQLLSAKPAWAKRMLQRMRQGSFDPGPLSETSLTAISSHGDPALNAALEQHLAEMKDDPAERRAQELFADGRVAYALNCAACHQDDGQGLTGLAPSLVASPWVQKGADSMIRIVLHGKENAGRGFVMPPLKHLDDAQIASILTYVRREFGNRADAVLPETVGQVRASTHERQKPWSDPELAKIND